MNGIIFGAGYVGCACIKEWPNKQDSLIATTTKEEKVAELRKLTPRVEVVKGSDRKKVAELIKEADFAIICVAPNHWNQYAETYLETAEGITQALSDRSRPFYLLYTSSTSVCGSHNGATIDESSPLLADSENGKILIATENCYLRAASSMVSICILRLGGIYGPGREIIDRARRFSGKTMTGRDSPTNHSSLPLITKGIIWSVHHRLTGIYHLVEDAHPTKNELYGNLLETLKLPPPVWEQPHTGGAAVSNRKFFKTGFQ